MSGWRRFVSLIGTSHFSYTDNDLLIEQIIAAGIIPPSLTGQRRSRFQAGRRVPKGRQCRRFNLAAMRLKGNWPTRMRGSERIIHRICFMPSANRSEERRVGEADR